MPERERQVLNLDALAVIRDAVSIGGREYEIKAASDLSPNDLAYLVKLSEEAQGVQDQDFNEEGVEDDAQPAPAGCASSSTPMCPMT